MPLYLLDPVVECSSDTAPAKSKLVDSADEVSSNNISVKLNSVQAKGFVTTKFHAASVVVQPPGMYYLERVDVVSFSLQCANLCVNECTQVVGSGHGSAVFEVRF